MQIVVRFFLSLLFAAIMTICIVLLEQGYDNNIYPDKTINENFRKTTALIISKQLTRSEDYPRQYRADFLISYKVNDVQYQRWVSDNGLDRSFDLDRRAQEARLLRYRIGQSYPCWYPPENPESAVLAHRHDWMAVLPMMIPAVTGVLVFYYFLKNFFWLAGAAFARISRSRLQNI
ncbi:hypothetical protein AQUSIP_03940 [Aquicella siphonis]|uniref:DUF3592 domain-containing protein n=1 Tax=Aquicella siphonis TaxID=254247 RepID=A0A5E4PF50_9COXI|nr:DUF3592 domain-containing protein [Aquicella siphonis]VVC75118.1 hypothetical protein AQUSIP_03940 [Aquicella siphonis]